MVLIAIVIAAIAQFFFPKSRLDPNSWLRFYMQKMLHLMGHSSQNTWLSVIFLSLPLWIAVLLILAILNWILGPIAYWLAVFFLSWLCLDIYPAYDETTGYDESWLVRKRDAVFSPIFWFGLFKTPLLVLYSIFRFMRDNWHDVEGNNQTTNPCSDILAVLAWIPARLMVIAAGVVGDFTATMKATSGFWFECLRADSRQFWTAMRGGLPQETSDSTRLSGSNKVTFHQYWAVLIVWLVIIAIFTLGYWFAR